MKLPITTAGTGPRTAALVHGASASSHIWRDFASILTDEYDMTVLTVDLRGHGASPRARSYRVKDFVDDLVDTLPIGLDYLIGQSLGGLAGAWAAPALKPQRFIGIDPAFDAHPRRVALMLALIGPWQPRMSDRALARGGFPPVGAAPDALSRTRESWSQWSNWMMPQLVLSGISMRFHPKPPAVPSTIVRADPSFVISDAAAKRFAEMGWDVRTKPGGVHDLHLQDPVGLAALLDDVLSA